MANFNNFTPLLIEAEGGFVNNPLDPGGATNKGWTLANYMIFGWDNDQDGDIDVDDLKMLTDDQAKLLYKQQFWDKMRASEIHDQYVANTYVDHGVNTGRWRSIMMMQYVLLTVFAKLIVLDGKIGQETLKAINSVDPIRLTKEFNDLRKEYYNFRANRLNFVRSSNLDFIDNDLKIAPNESQKIFINGWLRRVNLHQYPNKLGGAIGFFIFLIIALLITKNLS